MNDNILDKLASGLLLRSMQTFVEARLVLMQTW